MIEARAIRFDMDPPAVRDIPGLQRILPGSVAARRPLAA